MSKQEPEWVSKLRLRVETAKSDPRLPKESWKQWGLFVVTIWRMVKSIPAIFRGRRHNQAIKNIEKEAEQARKDRLRNPDKYRGK